MKDIEFTRYSAQDTAKYTKAIQNMIVKNIMPDNNIAVLTWKYLQFSKLKLYIRKTTIPTMPLFLTNQHKRPVSRLGI